MYWLWEKIKSYYFKTPKPLLKIKNSTLLENCINLIKLIGVKKFDKFFLSEGTN